MNGMPDEPVLTFLNTIISIYLSIYFNCSEYQCLNISPLSFNSHLVNLFLFSLRYLICLIVDFLAFPPG